MGSQVGRLAYITGVGVRPGGDAWRLDIAARLPAKHAAIAAHAALGGTAVMAASERLYEVLLRCDMVA
jgi:hypothetical protein